MLDSLFERFENIVVLDTETTGIDPRQEEIIELAAMRVIGPADKMRTEDEFDLLLRLSEGKRLRPVITELTGITEAELAGGVSKEEACGRFVEMLSRPNTLLAAYNAQFDLCFLYYFMREFGRAELLKNIKMLDILTIYKDRKPYPHKLSDAVAAYSLNTQNTHRAIDDTRAAFELLGEMGKERDDLARYINLFGYNPKYGVPRPKISSIKYLPQPYEAQGAVYEREGL